MHCTATNSSRRTIYSFYFSSSSFSFFSLIIICTKKDTSTWNYFQIRNRVRLALNFHMLHFESDLSSYALHFSISHRSAFSGSSTAKGHGTHRSGKHEWGCEAGGEWVRKRDWHEPQQQSMRKETTANSGKNLGFPIYLSASTLCSSICD